MRVTPEGGAGRTAPILSGSSYLSRNSGDLHFGLGNAVRAAVAVRWSDGTTLQIESVDAGQVLLVRDGTRAAYGAEVRMAVADDVNRLMREKYGWRDAYIDFLIGGRDEAVPVALIPN